MYLGSLLFFNPKNVFYYNLGNIFLQYNFDWNHGKIPLVPSLVELWLD